MFEVPRDRLFSIGAAIKLLASYQTVDTLQRLQHDIGNCRYSSLKRNVSKLQMQISQSLIWIFCRWRKGSNFRDLSVAVDGELVVSTSKLPAIGLNDNPGQ